jgi:protein SCO1/2
MKMRSLRAIRLAVWAAILLLGAAIVGIIFVGGPGGGKLPGVAAIGGPFELIDQHGAKVTEAALQGHPSALFFGYTFCPDVCPTTLSDMTDWLQKLGSEGDKLKVYFITVDPERDTKEQLASYLQAFDPRIIGLTGSRPAIDQILKAYRIYSRKVPEKDGTYSMDHSASVYLLDAKGTLTSTVDYQEDPDAVLKKLKRLIESS